MNASIAPAPGAVADTEPFTLVPLFARALALAEKEPKTITEMAVKLFEEGGELATSVNVYTGAVKKVLNEPVVGEVADVMLCCLTILQRATPDMTSAERLGLLAHWVAHKSRKWEASMTPTADADADADADPDRGVPQSPSTGESYSN